MTAITGMINVMVLALIIINLDKFAMLGLEGKPTRRYRVFLTHRMERISMWADGARDKPVGTGAIFDGDGNLSFAGKIENGMRQGVGISYKVEDGTIFVGKWKDNVPTGKGSEFDGDGNLIYTGMWKDGKRHGFGTEYNKEGKIVLQENGKTINIWTVFCIKK